MLSWGQAIFGGLHFLRLDSIKTKILVFALLATLIPSLTMGLRTYVLSKQLVTQRISEELRATTFQTARELNLWIKERFYEMRVFSSSYEVTENLETVLREPGGTARATEATRRLTDYLASVRSKFRDYEALMVLGPTGEVVSTGADRAAAPNLPPDWLKQAQAGSVIVGEPYWNETRNKGGLAIAVPLKAANGRFLGVMAGTLSFGSVEQILTGLSLGSRGPVYLVRRDGAVIVGSQSTGSAFMKTRLASETARVLFEQEEAPQEYDDAQGKPVIGILKVVFQLGWGAVAEIRRDEAYAQTARVRNLTLLMVVGLLLIIGLTAYLLGLTIVRPLDRLTAGATKVASGHLELDLPTVDHGEVGYLTRVFNHMVTRLRQGRDELDAINVALSEKNEELRELSITDGLTGLYNRKHLMQAIASEVARARRLRHRFSIMMIDIDRFKRYNDTYGHLAGDKLLKDIAALFRDSLRSIDYAARYGGEEFLLMLYEVGPEEALKAADRVRTRVAAARFGSAEDQGAVTVSIGVAAFPEHGHTPEDLIAHADAALYEAKESGRNGVVLAGGSQARPPHRSR